MHAWLNVSVAGLTSRCAAAAALALAVLAAGCDSVPDAQVAPPVPPPTTSAAPEPTAPAPTTPTVRPSPTAGRKAPPPAPPVPRGTGRFVFPVVAGRISYQGTHHDYPATDIFAACNSPVRAVTDGVVLEVSRVDRFDPAHPTGVYNGGLSVSLRGDDGVRYYGSHLTRVLPGIEAGVRVRAGQQVGTVGRTGNASNVCHLHFGISPVCAGTGDWWIRRGVIWPKQYLDAWRSGNGRSAAAEVTRWRQAHGCPPPPK
jgi:peptidoglycan LD-endopeptidase LytH